MLEQREAQKNLIKEIFRGCSCVELLETLKTIKSFNGTAMVSDEQSGILNKILSELSKPLFFEMLKSEKDRILIEVAIQELLDEKIKEISLSEIDEFSAYLYSENEELKQYNRKLREELLPLEESKKKAQEATKKDLNYKRLIVAATEGNLTDDQRILLENEYRKAKINEVDRRIAVNLEYLSKIKTQKSSKIKKR